MGCYDEAEGIVKDHEKGRSCGRGREVEKGSREDREVHGEHQE